MDWHFKCLFLAHIMVRWLDDGMLPPHGLGTLGPSTFQSLVVSTRCSSFCLETNLSEDVVGGFRSDTPSAPTHHRQEWSHMAPPLLESLYDLVYCLPKKERGLVHKVSTVSAYISPECKWWFGLLSVLTYQWEEGVWEKAEARRKECWELGGKKAAGELPQFLPIVHCPT